jgi:hypothetical protein
MNTPILARELETGALRAALRRCATPPRPIPHPEISPSSRFGGTR